MDSFFHELLTPILQSGNPAIMAILLIISCCITYLSYRRDSEYKKEREKLITEFQKQIEDDREDLLRIIERYQEGQISVIQALNEVKILISTIGARI